ncbi:MAG: FHA domain-containing protein [Verrucomicrobiota bacterium]
MSTSKFEATLAASIALVRREREARAHLLEQIEGEGAPQRIELAGAQLVIGRAENADVRLASPRLSRQHALLTRRGTDYVIRDHDSHNGIFLNGVKIHSATLRDGDIIQIADCAFVYRES